jgi:hypothetical protein
MGKDRCRFCGVKDDVCNLIEPCVCYKKLDDNRAHKR